MEIALTKMSSKGQIVIPVDMRKNFREGDSFVIIKIDDRRGGRGRDLDDVTAGDQAPVDDKTSLGHDVTGVVQDAEEVHREGRRCLP